MSRFNIRLIVFLATVLVISLPLPAYAYIGPGTGLGALLAAIALILGLILLVMGIVWYPLKRLFKSRTKKVEKSDEKEGEE